MGDSDEFIHGRKLCYTIRENSFSKLREKRKGKKERIEGKFALLSLQSFLTTNFAKYLEPSPFAIELNALLHKMLYFS